MSRNRHFLLPSSHLLDVYYISIHRTATDHGTWRQQQHCAEPLYTQQFPSSKSKLCDREVPEMPTSLWHGHY
jgi:hypothetical protein